MNVEEAKENIGKEVVLDGSTKPYTRASGEVMQKSIFKNIESAPILIISGIFSGNVELSGDGFATGIHPRHLKLKEQDMNYKIRVTPETSKEVQELFFELGGLHGNGESHTVVVPSICGIALFDGLIHFIFNEVAFKKENIQEITLLQLRDMVVLNRNDVSDANHVQKYDESNKFYIGEKIYNWEGKWNLSGLDNDGVEEHLKPIYPQPKSEMTLQDALLAISEGKEVLFNGMILSQNMNSYLKTHFLGCSFSLKPKTVKLEYREYAEEELLKLIEELRK